jgi:hypothetical protein
MIILCICKEERLTGPPLSHGIFKKRQIVSFNGGRPSIFSQKPIRFLVAVVEVVVLNLNVRIVCID